MYRYACPRIGGKRRLHFRLQRCGRTPVREGGHRFPNGTLPVDLGAAIHTDLAHIDLGCFAYLQCQLIVRGCPQPFAGPVPGVYQLVVGERLLNEATADELYSQAVTYMDELHADPLFVTDRLLGHGRLKRTVRLLCTKVWPTLYHVLVLSGHEGIRVWNMTKNEAIRETVELSALFHVAEAFYDAVRTYYPKQTRVQDALAVIKHGVNVLAEAKRWWQTQQ